MDDTADNHDSGVPEIDSSSTDFRGFVDALTDRRVAGWAYQEGRNIPRISIFINSEPYGDFDCNMDRLDAAQFSKKPAKGFDILLDASLNEGDTLWVYHAGTKLPLRGRSNYRHPTTETAFAVDLLSAGSGGNNGGMEARVAKLEADVGHIKDTLSEMKQDVRDLRSDLKTEFRLAFGALIFVTLGLAGLMAKGFHWI